MSGDPNTLTLGFARRFATYRDRTCCCTIRAFASLLEPSQRPVQLIIAGKAHSQRTKRGRLKFGNGYSFINGPRRATPMAVFLGDYDMLLTDIYVQGVDVLDQHAGRPWEACGTSGMRCSSMVGINLDLRILDA